MSPDFSAENDAFLLDTELVQSQREDKTLRRQEPHRTEQQHRDGRRVLKTHKRKTSQP